MVRLGRCFALGTMFPFSSGQSSRRRWARLRPNGGQSRRRDRPGRIVPDSPFRSPDSRRCGGHAQQAPGRELRLQKRHRAVVSTRGGSRSNSSRPWEVVVEDEGARRSVTRQTRDWDRWMVWMVCCQRIGAGADRFHPMVLENQGHPLGRRADTWVVMHWGRGGEAARNRKAAVKFVWGRADDWPTAISCDQDRFRSI
jgi:hypothetical protein